MRADDVRWGLRVASRPADGAGHVMRGLALAEALDRQAVFFLDAGTASDGQVTDAGFAWRAEPDPAGAHELEAAISSGEVQAAIVDSYDLTPAAVEALCGHGLCVALDDLGGKVAGQAVLNPGLGGRDARYNLPASHILAGPEYALLRTPFKSAHDDALRRRPRDGAPLNVLLSMGAVDSPDATGLTLDALAHVAAGGIDMAVTVVLGRDAPHFERVRKAVTEFDGRNQATCRLLSDIDDMIPIYQRSDLSVGAGGVSFLERLCCGVPSILITLADNQLANAAAAERLGVAIHAGTAATLDAPSVSRVIGGLAADPARRDRLRRTGLAIIDGRGAERAAARLGALHAEYHEHQVSL